MFAAQVEVGQLDELTGLSSKSVGNLTYWLAGSVLHATLDLRDGALSKPLSLYAAKTPPTGPPPLLDAEVRALLVCCVQIGCVIRVRVSEAPTPPTGPPPLLDAEVCACCCAVCR